jgi:3-phosphoshikimate 1-carboxyvinyltransferase
VTASLTIFPSNINGTILSPTSKSSMQRACAAALLAQGTSTLYNCGASNDDKAALDIIENLGATLLQKNNSLVINSTNFNNNKIQNKIQINCHESGLCARMFTSIASIVNNQVEVVGSGSLLSRSLHFFDEVLPKLQVDIESNKGHLPLKIKGALQPQNITIDGSKSSQYITGLIMAFAFIYTHQKNKLPSTITVIDATSKPYIDLTLHTLASFNLYTPKNKNYQQFIFNNKGFIASKKDIDFTIESDWSNTAFLMVAGAIAGKICIKNVSFRSVQADKIILKIFEQCQANFRCSNNEIFVETSTLKAFVFDATNCPDLFPPLAVLAACCQGTSTIKGLNRLIDKESNRAKTLETEFLKAGIAIKVVGNSFKIKGSKSAIIAANFDSHNDHRIAMACSLLALVANGKSTIKGYKSVEKSYPNFFENLKQLGVDFEIL